MELPFSQVLKHPIASSSMSPLTPAETLVNLSFNVPFSSNLPGPDVDEILHSSPDALRRWTFPEGTEDGTPIHKLPVHAFHVEQLRRLCRVLSDGIVTGTGVEATVTSSEPKQIPGIQRVPVRGLVTNVCVSGDADTVHRLRAKILNETPIALVGLLISSRYLHLLMTRVEMRNCGHRHRAHHRPGSQRNQSQRARTYR